MDTKILCTSLAFSIGAAIDAIDIMVDGSLESLALSMGSKKRIRRSFDDCVILFYECLFRRLRIQLPFSDFKVVILKYLKVHPSQLQLGSWAYVRIFQLCVEHKSRKHSLRLFFDIFHPKRSSKDNFQNQRLICLYPVNLWFDPFATTLTSKAPHTCNPSRFFATSLSILLASVGFYT